ncbi:MAG: glycosyltransferase family 4 protein [Candidatus Moranbacteria bacterium]|nr:glycosyltransferase family 4 protein [Candidatus Moranbacteria bacterium]
MKKNEKKKILWFSWKDIKNPAAGGAEKIADVLLSKMAEEGFEVVLLTSRFKGSGSRERINGYTVIRQGNRFFVYWKAWRYFRKHLRDWQGLIVEEVNTFPFFTQFYSNCPRFLFFHQLCREVWFYELPPPLGWLGYRLEPWYLWALNKNKVITVSDSTKKDLVKLGFSENKIKTIPESVDLKPLKNLEDAEKYENPTLLSLGYMRPMKRVLDKIEIFERAKREIPGLKLVIAGGGKADYKRRVIKRVNDSKWREDIHYLGSIDKKKKVEILQKSHIILETSVKEGWGLTVTEAAGQGTPAVVYDVDGLRESVVDGKTGLVVENNSPGKAAEAAIELLNNKKRYEKMRKNAWQESHKFNFEKSYNNFKNIIENNE